MAVCESVSYEVWLLAELVPPVLAAVTVWRVSPPGLAARWVAVVLVCHANLVLWASVLALVATRRCGQAAAAQLWDHLLVAVPVTAAVNLLAALHNDQFYPVARFSLRQAQVFFDHLHASAPTVKVVARPSRQQAVYPAASWADSTHYPALAPGRRERDWFLRISVEAAPEEDGVTEEDFHQFVNTFAQSQQVNSDKLNIVSVIAGKSISPKTPRLVGRRMERHALGLLPCVRSDQPCRVFVTSEPAALVPTLLKLEWILNVFGWAGPVMAATALARARTRDLRVVKRFRACSALPDHLSVDPGTSSRSVPRTAAAARGQDTRDPLEEAIPALVTHRLLHTPARHLVTVVTGDTEPGAGDHGHGHEDLPPSYSLLDFQDLPHYNDVKIA